VSARRRTDEAGFASLILPVLLWVATLAAVAIVDVAAYLVTASRAQTLADAAALAAVSAEATLPPAGSPRARAATVAAAGGGTLERCVCAAGSARTETAVSLPVPGLVIPRLGAGRVEATATAALTPPPPG
jgi:hypothetical protein